MARRSERTRDPWEELSTVMRASAYSLYSGTSVYLISDPEDFAQDVSMAVWKFAQRRANEHEEFTIDDGFMIEMFAYGYRCLKHRFFLELRKVRNRNRLFPTRSGDPEELEQMYGVLEPGFVSEEQRLIAESMIEAMQKRMKTNTARRIIEGLKRLDDIFDRDSEISMTMLGEEIVLSRDTIKRFGAKVRRHGILTPRTTRGEPAATVRQAQIKQAKGESEDENDEVA